MHDRYGGVVPEIASRHHLELVNAVVDDALAQAGATLDDVDLIAFTQGPGLVGALLVGVATAKGAGRGPRGCPSRPSTTCRATWRRTSSRRAPFEPPFLCLIASGGHTLLTRVEDHAATTTLGRTLDDAAGEAFDKGARLLGLGYPGGPALSRLAATATRTAFAFPTAARVAGLDFSFAGLKTALLYKVRDLGEEETARRARRPRRQLRARDRRGADRARCGGPWSPDRPRPRGARWRRGRQPAPAGAGAGLGVDVHVPPPALCTDNAAMIASAARWVTPVAFPDYLGVDAYATA